MWHFLCPLSRVFITCTQTHLCFLAHGLFSFALSFLSEKLRIAFQPWKHITQLSTLALPGTPAPRKQRQEDWEVEAPRDYDTKPYLKKPANNNTTLRPCSLLVHQACFLSLHFHKPLVGQQENEEWLRQHQHSHPWSYRARLVSEYCSSVWCFE